jgi:uncharacterized membrane protein
MTLGSAHIPTPPVTEAAPVATNRWVRRFAIALAVLGIIFRFSGLDTKVFWQDEAHTGRGIAGSWRTEIMTDVFDGEVHTRDELLRHQFPRHDRNIVDVIRLRAIEEPRQAPLYFVLARAWVLAFGHSIAVLRSFSAVLSVLGLLLVFALCHELFERSTEGWLAVGLIAISPLHIAFAQEARFYMLWADLVLLASWLLLRGGRLAKSRQRQSGLMCALYAGTIALALYCHILTVLVIAAHMAFVVVDERLRWTATLRFTAAGQLGGILLFSPWIWFIAQEAKAGPSGWVSWTATPVATGDWLLGAARTYVRPFFDANTVKLATVQMALAVVVLVTATLWMVVRWAPRRTLWFLLPMGIFCSLPFAVLDLTGGGWRFHVTRYQFPAVLALQLCVAFALAHLLFNKSRWMRGAGVASAVLFVACGLLSNHSYRRAGMWWNKGGGQSVVLAAKHASMSQAPLIIVSGRHFGSPVHWVLSLAHALNDDARVLAVAKPKTPLIPDEYEDVYLWRVSPEMRGFRRCGLAGRRNRWRLPVSNLPEGDPPIRLSARSLARTSHRVSTADGKSRRPAVLVATRRRKRMWPQPGITDERPHAGGGETQAPKARRKVV